MTVMFFSRHILAILWQASPIGKNSRSRPPSPALLVLLSCHPGGSVMQRAIDEVLYLSWVSTCKCGEKVVGNALRATACRQNSHRRAVQAPDKDGVPRTNHLRTDVVAVDRLCIRFNVPNCTIDIFQIHHAGNP